MPFIGKQPQTGAYSKLDAITTSATATYNLTLDSSAYYPQSANHLLVSLNGVMQAPQDSFTVSGSQITFASALTSSDNIDFIMALGDTLDIGTPSAGSVNTSQLANDAVTGAKIADDAIDSEHIADDAVGSAAIADDAITSAKIANGAANTLVTHQQLDHALTTSSGWLESGHVTIPESGVWKIETTNRIRWGANTYYIKSALSTSSTDGDGIFTEHRMLIERVSTNSFGNIGNTVSWMVDVPSGATTPLDIYLHVHYQSGDTYNGQYSDSNGRPFIVATKLYESSQTDTTVDEVVTKTS